MDHMGPMSFENPIGYYIVIGVIVFVVIILLVTRDKKSNVVLKEDGNADNEQIPAEIKKEITVNSPTPKTDIFYYKKKHGVGVATQIIPNFFKNGSSLVITSNGNRERKKMKHCFV